MDGIMKSSKRLGQELSGAWTIAKKDIGIYYFKAPVFIFGIIFPFFLFLAFTIGRNIPSLFLFPGIIGITLFFTASSIGPIIMPWETRMRTLERLLSCPVSIQLVLLGDIIAGFLFAIIISLVPLLLALFVFGLTINNLAIFVLCIFFSSFCFSSLGVLLSSPPTDNPSNIMMVSNLVRLPIMFISGIFIPIEDLPAAGKIIANFSPLTYTVDLLRYTFQGVSYYSITRNILMLILFLVIFLVLGMRLHKGNLARRL